MTYTCISFDEIFKGTMKGFKDQLPLAPLTYILQQGAGEQAGQGLGLGHVPQAPHCLTPTFSTVVRRDVEKIENDE